MKVGQTVIVKNKNELQGQQGIIVDKYINMPLVYFPTLSKGMQVGNDFLHNGNINEEGNCFYIEEKDLENLYSYNIEEFIDYHSKFELNKEIKDFICNIIKIAMK